MPCVKIRVDVGVSTSVVFAHQKKRKRGVARGVEMITSSRPDNYLLINLEVDDDRKAPPDSRRAAIDEALKKEREEMDLDAFLPSYERATGFALVIEEVAEHPDFITRRSDGLIVGIELTAVREQGPLDTPSLSGNSYGLSCAGP